MYGERWKSLRLKKVTLVDKTLPHQVSFLKRGDRVYVSCVCRRRPMGETRTLEESRCLYNDPRYHQKPFDPAVDGARW